jgi:cytochrome c556
MKSLVLAAAAAVVGVATTLPAAAQFQKPEDAIKYRQSVFTVMVTHFSRIGAMANGRVPFDAAAAAANAEIVAAMSKLPYVAFIDGTAIGTGNTRAKPEIWTDRAKFDAGAARLQEETAKLSAAAKSGNLEQLKVAFGNVGLACKGCHDVFRKD